MQKPTRQHCCGAHCKSCSCGQHKATQLIMCNIKRCSSPPWVK